MATATSIPKQAQMIITLEDNALVADIKRALKLIRGIASVRTASISDDNTITPALRRSINKARREYAKTYLDSLCKGDHPRLWKVRESRRWLYFPKKDNTTE